MNGLNYRRQTWHTDGVGECLLDAARARVLKDEPHVQGGLTEFGWGLLISGNFELATRNLGHR